MHVSLLDWVFDNLYIVAVIGFALFSFIGKAAKTGDPKKKGTNTGMPTFGGGGEPDWNRQNSPQQAAGPQSSKGENDDYERDEDERYEDVRYDDHRGEQHDQPAASSSRADDFGGHLSQGKGASLHEQMMEVERQQRLIQERMDRIASANAAAISELPDEQGTGAEPGRPVLSREDIRSGVLWAEVLGPPRSKQPFGTRGKL